ncbi:MAG: ATP-grasp domain-containing protein [Phycisphaeraceae bacterium]
MNARNVFVVGAEDFNFNKLRTIPAAEECRFHPLFSFEQVQGPRRYAMDRLLALAERKLRAFPERIDGIIGYWDLPVSAMVPLLANRFGLPAAPLPGVIACEHKYWSRLIQQRALGGEGVPAFRLVDPFANGELPAVGLGYPFWLKPIKSFQSHLGFRVDDDGALVTAIRAIRAGIGRLAEPFNRLLEHVELPAEVAQVRGEHCVAEQLIGGSQCTVEGYAFAGTAHSYGIIDSIRYDGVSSFARYEYPSLLPPTVQQRMRETVARLVPALGLTHGAFNIEFFWDEANDRLWLIEINPRMSQSHADLFEKVDGVSHHQVVVDLALGREPRWQTGRGMYRCAAKCYLRTFRDGVVTRVPDAEELARIAREMPGTIVRPSVREGQRLSDVPDEDSYSYPLAQIYLGADSREELLARYARCVEMLGFEVSSEPIAPMQPAG